MLYFAESNATETIVPQCPKRKIVFNKKQEMSQETVKENSNPVVSDKINLNTIKTGMQSFINQKIS